MEITKLEHSGLVVEKAGQKIVFDPVEFTETLPELTGVVAIVITHIHSDHLQLERIAAIRDRNPETRVYGSEEVQAQIPDAIILQGGDELMIGGFEVKVFGKDHATVVAGKVPCQNIGVVVDDKLVNPGDSFDLLEVGGDNDVLLVPEVAPWAKISETIEFVKIAKPKVVVPIHDGLLSAMGKTIYDNLLRAACVEIGAEFAPLGVGESMSL